MTDDSPEKNQAALRRWRLILGRYADPSLSRQAAYNQSDIQLNQSLDYLYDREYDERGLAKAQGGSLDPSQIRAIDWLNRTRKLFPHAVFERIQSQAIERYGLVDLLKDPTVLQTMEPNQALVKTLLTMRGRLSQEVIEGVRQIIKKTVDEITQRLKADITNAIVGRKHRFRRSHLRSAQNFDWHRTIRQNLKNYDAQSEKIIIERPLFYARVKRQLPWDIVLCVDQSGSMCDSILYAAVLAGILAGLPSVNVRLIVFDTQVVDLTHLAHDPVEVLLTVQLGGGTDIGKAVRYCEQKIQTPHRTIFTLISDFCEGAPQAPLLASLRRMYEARVRLLGLAALDDNAKPVYDHDMAGRLSACGMHIAALTPHHFAEWLGEVMQSS